jgi:hypothetical protein
MPYQPGNFVQDPAPMNRPNINATPVDYFDYFTTDQENNLNLIDKLVTETNLYAERFHPAVVTTDIRFRINSIIKIAVNRGK